MSKTDNSDNPNMWFFWKPCPVFLILGSKQELFVTSDFNIKLCCCHWKTFRITVLRKQAKPSCPAFTNNR